MTAPDPLTDQSRWTAMTDPAERDRQMRELLSELDDPALRITWPIPEEG